MDIIKKGNYLKIALFGYILTGAQVYAQTDVESAEAYDKCQNNVPACQQTAKQGDASSQYNLGRMYFFGEGVPQNYDIAKQLWKQASVQGNPQGQNALGTIYYFDKGVQQQNIELAKSLFMQAAQQGEYKGILNLDKMVNNRDATDQDVIAAVVDFRRFHQENKKQLEQQSDSGNADASYKLSLMYTDDEIVKYDPEKKIHYLEKAAKQGNASAQYEIGYFYSGGRYGFKLDREKARNYFIQADKQGNSDAAYSLYDYYRYYNKPEPNMGEAIKYLQKAADQRHVEAIIDMANYYYNGCEPYLKQDYEKAFQYYEIIATTLRNKAMYFIGQGYQRHSMYQLGVMYENGQGVTKSTEKAMEWFKISCDKGYQDSCDKLNNKG
ncbi:sel1 repeat family protein [Salmonella enterica subsp. enterica]|nr:sel1 repeat family protein [Salmonella enterica subsp. enterica]EAQ6073397.1 sel1 repeat family protein [Salmonella enterica]EDR2627275.1 sel1 repeat family protein [Salmonella enterica subsp. enterica serovar Thompson]EAW1858145.1 sel1 repeat family protein [Salmonella enterica subsp. enterica]EAW1861750.1 sel1 repeat family protein [Salmonella enterica subsp. enterica]